ncbi:hypothetical protein [Ideonella sp.]|uniref:DUF7940 domain-containing protein n=1 Tax=Ideonella sp. TaxID=1929293 RepID=UPI003BB54715
MKLLDDWKLVLKKAWSIRLWALAAVFEAAGMVLPLFVDSMPRVAFSLLSLVAAGGGIWARLIEQKGVKR